MKFELILQIILFTSSVGLGVIVLRKLPVLRVLPEKEFSGFSEKKQIIALKFKEGVKKLNLLKDLSYEMILEKVLAKIKNISVKFESKMSNLLVEAKENTKQRGIRESDNYWEEIKKSTKKNKLKK
ncbi:MAG: hypothetical protein KJI70_03290 [Patescibacteria group bacterium]|nr:hypothetical protein [Patescibacteria group bacterium]